MNSQCSNPAAHQRAVVVAKFARATGGLWAAFDRLVAAEQANGTTRYDAMLNVGKAHPDLWQVLRAEPRHS